jgi:hypothetical protein
MTCSRERVWFYLTRKNWHSQRRRLAFIRSLYWVVIRGYETEICSRHGGPVGLVYHVPDALWAQHAGFHGPGGLLCPQCFSDLYGSQGGFLRWTCATDDEVMHG